jgi:hypothetical protein
MTRWMLTGALFAALTLTACEKKPTVVDPTVTSMPGPASPPGAPGGGLGQQVPQGALVPPQKPDGTESAAPPEPVPAD